MFINTSSEDFLEGYGSVYKGNTPYILHIQLERDTHPSIVWNLSQGHVEDYIPSCVEWGCDYIDPDLENDFPQCVSDESLNHVWEYVREKVGVG